LENYLAFSGQENFGGLLQLFLFYLFLWKSYFLAKQPVLLPLFIPSFNSMKKVIRKWKQFAQVVAKIQSGIVLSLIYLIFILPISFFLKTFFKKSIIKYQSQNSRSYWIKKENITQDLAWAKKQ